MPSDRLGLWLDGVPLCNGAYEERRPPAKASVVNYTQVSFFGRYDRSYVR